MRNNGVDSTQLAPKVYVYVRLICRNPHWRPLNIRWSGSTMTSHRRDNDHSMFTSKTPHFFKVILEEAIRDGKLGIPRKFLRKYGKRLPSQIQLEVPSGEIWQVELTKCDERVWLQKGWQEFAEHYSLGFGYFVVFRYEGNAHFRVLIFDNSASEIEYPYSSIEDDMSVELCDDVSASRNSEEKSDLSCSHKKMRTNSLNQPGTDLKLEILSSRITADDPKSSRIKLENLKKVEKSRCFTGQLDVPSSATKGVGGITAPRSVKTEVLSCVQRLTAIEKAHAIQRASAFKITENPIFMVFMQPSFVHNRYRMGIPSNFARKFLTMQKGNLTLCDSTGKTWPAKYYLNVDKKNRYAQIHCGWRAFAEDNNLDVGDICVFELIKHPEILLKVVIYPVVENASKACTPLADGSITSQVKIKRLISDTEPNRGQSRCPSSSREFKDTMIEEKKNIHLHNEILDDFPLNQRTKNKLPSPCFQPCKMMKTNPSGSIQAKGIKLEKQKKSVDFRYLTKELGGEFKFSAKDDSGGMSSARRCQKPDLMGKIRPLTPTEKERACVRATAFKSANPSFTVLIQPSYVLTRSTLNIPYRFAKRYFKKNGEVTLRVLDGRTWIVDYKRKVTSLSARAKFYGNSWKAFVLDNNLKVGDICVFELIKGNKILLEVVIFSAADTAICSSSKLGCTT